VLDPVDFEILHFRITFLPKKFVFLVSRGKNDISALFPRPGKIFTATLEKSAFGPFLEKSFRRPLLRSDVKNMNRQIKWLTNPRNTESSTECGYAVKSTSSCFFLDILIASTGPPCKRERLNLGFKSSETFFISKRALKTFLVLGHCKANLLKMFLTNNFKYVQNILLVTGQAIHLVDHVPPMLVNFRFPVGTHRSLEKGYLRPVLPRALR